MNSFLPADYIIPTTPPDFITHQNYVDCMSSLSTGLTVEYTSRVRPIVIPLDGVRFDFF